MLQESEVYIGPGTSETIPEKTTIQGLAKGAELSVIQKHIVHHPSSMGQDLRDRKQKMAPSLAGLLEKSLKHKGEYYTVETNWLDPEHVEITGVSSMALHYFTLQAEALGLDVTYEKTTKIKIVNK